MRTLTVGDLAFGVHVRPDDFGPDELEPTQAGVVTVVVALLNLDGDPTPLEAERTGVPPEDELQVAEYLAQRLAAEHPRTTQVTVGATTWHIRRKPERPWHPKVYDKIKQTLIRRGFKTHKAHALACKYAKRKGKPEVLLARFHQDHPDA